MPNGEYFGMLSIIICIISLLMIYVFVLLHCREDQKVSHYIINKINTDPETRYRIGDQDFPDIPSLLNFYKTHYLDTTSLIRPAEKKEIKVIARYDFEGRVSVVVSPQVSKI